VRRSATAWLTRSARFSGVVDGAHQRIFLSDPRAGRVWFGYGGDIQGNVSGRSGDTFNYTTYGSW
jgi:hypothetical protein